MIVGGRVRTAPTNGLLPNSDNVVVAEERIVRAKGR